jgi:hypothetical protein
MLDLIRRNPVDVGDFIGRSVSVTHNEVAYMQGPPLSPTWSFPFLQSLTTASTVMAEGANNGGE